MPAPTMKVVPNSTRNTLRRDHSIMRFSMSAPLVLGGTCGRTPHRLCGSRGDAVQHQLPGDLLHDIEFHCLPGLDPFEQRLVLHLEVHGHRRKVEAWNRIMTDVDGAILLIHRAHGALTLVYLAGRGSRALRCGRLLLGAAEGSQRRLEIAFGVDQEISADYHVFSGL